MYKYFKSVICETHKTINEVLYRNIGTQTYEN